MSSPQSDLPTASQMEPKAAAHEPSEASMLGGIFRSMKDIGFTWKDKEDCGLAIDALLDLLVNVTKFLPSNVEEVPTFKAKLMEYLLKEGPKNAVEDYNNEAKLETALTSSSASPQSEVAEEDSRSYVSSAESTSPIAGSSAPAAPVVPVVGPNVTPIITGGSNTVPAATTQNPVGPVTFWHMHMAGGPQTQTYVHRPLRRTYAFSNLSLFPPPPLAPAAPAPAPAPAVPAAAPVIHAPAAVVLAAVPATVSVPLVQVPAAPATPRAYAEVDSSGDSLEALDNVDVRPSTSLRPSHPADISPLATRSQPRRFLRPRLPSRSLLTASGSSSSPTASAKEVKPSFTTGKGKKRSREEVKSDSDASDNIRPTKRMKLGHAMCSSPLSELSDSKGPGPLPHPVRAGNPSPPSNRRVTRSSASTSSQRITIPASTTRPIARAPATLKRCGAFYGPSHPDIYWDVTWGANPNVPYVPTAPSVSTATKRSRDDVEDSEPSSSGDISDALSDVRPSTMQKRTHIADDSPLTTRTSRSKSAASGSSSTSPLSATQGKPFTGRGKKRSREEVEVEVAADVLASGSEASKAMGNTRPTRRVKLSSALSELHDSEASGSSCHRVRAPTPYPTSNHRITRSSSSSASVSNAGSAPKKLTTTKGKGKAIAEPVASSSKKPFKNN